MTGLMKKKLPVLPEWVFPLVLLLVCGLSYALLFNQLGFYWDDWPFNFIAQKIGPEGLQRYFSTNRPFLGMMVRWTTALLGSQPWRWQLFAVFWRWLSAVALWGLLRLLFRRSAQPAMWTALFYAVYPGAVQQFIALVFSHFFIILTLFFCSLLCSVAALRYSRWKISLLIAGLVCAFANLMVLEYFFLLELLRPCVLWFALQEEEKDLRRRLRRVLSAWLPYLGLFIGVVIWRTFFFTYQTTNYRPGLLADLKAAPLAALGQLLLTILKDGWTVSFAAWGQVFRFDQAVELGQRTFLVLLAIMAVSALGLVIFLVWKTHDEGPSEKPRWLAPWALPLLLLGLLAILLGGGPYWLVHLAVDLGFPSSRVTLSFMLGVSLLLAGLVGLLPNRWVRPVVVGLLVGLAVGYQFGVANVFRRDWRQQNNLLWQMTWRIPALQADTVLLINDLPVHFSTDNSLTASINWVYSTSPLTTHIPYLLYYPSLRLGSGLPAFEPGLPVKVDYLAAWFEGNTSQALALYYNPPACLRLLDPEIDGQNTMLLELMRDASVLSNPAVILSATDAPPLEADIFGSEPQHGWCYYFEKADLARQMGDWAMVVNLGDQAFALDDYPNDPAERLVFIEGYAHAGRWEEALDLSRQTIGVTSLMKPPLCNLWQRIQRDLSSDSQGEATWQTVRQEADCP